MSRALVLLLIGVLNAALPRPAFPQKVVFTAPESRAEALTLIKEMEAHEGLQDRMITFFVSKPTRFPGAPITYVNLDFKSDFLALKFQVRGGPAIPLRFEYELMPKPAVISDSLLGIDNFGVRLSDEWALWIYKPGIDAERDLAWAKWLAAILSARRALVGEAHEALERRFKEALEKYPESGNRPPMPEEARAARVRAEAAVERKDMAAALQQYTTAVGTAPWWAEGYFNIAMLYAYEKRYDRAIRNMQRFLLLEPGHPKAREAKDEIYVWQDLAKAAK